MKTNIPAAEILYTPNTFQPAGVLDDEKTAKVEIVETTVGYNLPKLHLTWLPLFFVDVANEAEAEQLKALGYDVRKNNFSTGYGHTYAKPVSEKCVRHVWFCNFRRYGWSLTDETEGEYGYAFGETYANGTLWGSLEKTAEDVVKNSLVATWSTAMESGRIPKFFHTMAVQDALGWLCQDALKNISHHANPGHRNGSACDELEKPVPHRFVEKAA